MTKGCSGACAEIDYTSTRCYNCYSARIGAPVHSSDSTSITKGSFSIYPVPASNLLNVEHLEVGQTIILRNIYGQAMIEVKPIITKCRLI